MNMNILRSFILSLGLVATMSFAQDVSDAGIWSATDDSFQGLNFVPVGPTLFDNSSLIVFWYTYDSEGNQLWFISDNVKTNQTFQRVNLFNPICGFRLQSDDCSVGDPVGVLDIMSFGRDSFDIRFALDTAVGDFAEVCDLQGVIRPRPSPTPPALPTEFECQGEMIVKRVTPAVE